MNDAEQRIMELNKLLNNMGYDPFVANKEITLEPLSPEELRINDEWLKKYIEKRRKREEKEEREEREGWERNIAVKVPHEKRTKKQWELLDDEPTIEELKSWGRLDELKYWEKKREKREKREKKIK